MSAQSYTLQIEGTVNSTLLIIEAEMRCCRSKAMQRNDLIQLNKTGKIPFLLTGRNLIFMQHVYVMETIISYLPVCMLQFPIVPG